ncbi:hypothetical protein ANAEL_01363 [Anaerolineales bacterium]|nr:hypothetical protein ANAEL_01363 [Anaerolineales bacterium]
MLPQHKAPRLILSGLLFMLLLSNCLPHESVDRIDKYASTEIAKSIERIPQVATVVCGSDQVCQAGLEATKYLIEFEVGLAKIAITNSAPPLFKHLASILPDNVEIGYSPIYIPIRISIDLNGNITISVSPHLVTPIGVFDVTASKKIISQEDQRLLIIQVDDKVSIFKLSELPKNEDYKVEFYGDDKLYKRVVFELRSNKDIYLVLESANKP